MKAVVYHHYGSPEMLHVEEIQKPVPGRDEVLVKVHAVSVNDWDLGLLRGKPLVNRLLFGLFKPRRKILGSDIAGTIEMVGSNVKQWKVGDEVFGDLSGRWGGFAEYAVAPAAALMLKPPGMNFEQAAAVPQAALLALQGLRNKMTVQKGHHVLINGGGGGAGTFAIQMAKSVGATVTAVDSASKLETMLSVGADHVIDYKSEDFTKNGQQYDLILDLAAYHSIFDYKKSLTPNGRYIMVGGSSSLGIQLLLLGSIVTIGSNKKFSILVHKPNKHLDLFLELFEAGKVVPIIERCYSLGQVPEALAHFLEGKAKGKLVVSIIRETVKPTFES